MTEPLGIVIVVAVGFIAVTIAITVFAMFPLLRQVRQLLSRMDAMIQATEGDIRLTLSELREAVHNANQISAGVHKNMDQLSGTIKALGGLSETLNNTSNIIRTTIHPHLLTFGALMVGLKTGSWYVFRKLLKRRR